MKILKVKVGEIYKNGERVPVYKTYWPRKDKEGKTYYEFNEVMFIKEIVTKPKEEEIIETENVDL